jgi:hypothetical protein
MYAARSARECDANVGTDEISALIRGKEMTKSGRFGPLKASSLLQVVARDAKIAAVELVLPMVGLMCMAACKVFRWQTHRRVGLSGANLKRRKGGGWSNDLLTIVEYSE